VQRDENWLKFLSKMFKNLTEQASSLIRKMSMSTISRETNIYFSDACLTCEQECDYPQLPETMQKRIDQSTLYKTFKPYKYHVVVPNGKSTEWADHVEEVTGPVQSIHSKTQESKHGRIMVTAYETDQENPGYFVFPLGIQIRPKEDQLELVGEWIANRTETDLNMEQISIDSKAIIFICCHKKRDKRCGVAGPMLMKQFKQELEVAGLSNQVQVYPISHIGGHKFAGTMIIYRKDARNIFVGDWYGRVKPSHVGTIIAECIEKGKVIQELWRGQMNADPNDPNLDW
jgi:(2Fe-2S) ferredoxin